jgi:hypothetical protein
MGNWRRFHRTEEWASGMETLPSTISCSWHLGEFSNSFCVLSSARECAN